MSDPVPRLATGSTGAGDLILATDNIHGEADFRAHRTYAVLLASDEAEEPGGEGRSRKVRPRRTRMG